MAIAGDRRSSPPVEIGRTALQVTSHTHRHIWKHSCRTAISWQAVPPCSGGITGVCATTTPVQGWASVFDAGTALNQRVWIVEGWGHRCVLSCRWIIRHPAPSPLQHSSPLRHRGRTPDWSRAVWACPVKPSAMTRPREVQKRFHCLFRTQTNCENV